MAFPPQMEMIHAAEMQLTNHDLLHYFLFGVVAKRVSPMAIIIATSSFCRTVI